MPGLFEIQDDTRTSNSNQNTMKYQNDQANPTNEEVNLITDGDNEDSKVADGPGDETIVDAEAGDEAGDDSLTTVCAQKCMTRCFYSWLTVYSKGREKMVTLCSWICSRDDVQNSTTQRVATLSFRNDVDRLDILVSSLTHLLSVNFSFVPVILHEGSIQKEERHGDSFGAKVGAPPGRSD
jgi:hypothetical protein